MTTDLLRPPIVPTTHTALHRSQLAPHVLSSLAPSTLPYPLSLLFESDSVEKWTALETLFYSCLQSGDNSSAKTCLDRLTTRFGAESERITGLTGIYHEAVAENDAALEGLLTRYRATIKEQPTNMVIRKRQVALLKSMGRTAEAMQALVELLDLSPVDAESWAEMAEMYFTAGMYSQAVYCYEDVLLTTPNAWNIHARLGEILYISSTTSDTATDSTNLRALVRSLKSFSRSLELCDDYLRGFYGLHLVTSALQKTLSQLGNSGIAKLPADEDFPVPSVQTVEKLKELATKKLAEIVRRSSAKEVGWSGYGEEEIKAVRTLLDREGGGVAR